MKKKMLFITPRISIPANSGGLIVTLNAIKFLAKIFDLDLIFFVDYNVELDLIIKKLKGYGVKDVICIKQKLKSKNLINILISLFSNTPLSIYRNKSKNMEDKISKIIKNYDFIYADHWLTMQFIPQDTNAQIFLREHNAEYKMWERLLKIEKNIVKKLYLFIETKKIKKYEKNICNKATQVMTITNEDKDSLIKIGVKKENITMLPGIIIDGLDNKPFSDFNLRSNNLMYVGSLSWDANIDGLVYFLNNIYPNVKAKIPDIKFYIIGKNPPESLQKFAQKDKSIILTGFVQDLKKYYVKSKLFVVYLRYGSGIKIKILEALSNAMPVITNDIGIEGIYTGGVALAVNDKEFSEKIILLLKNNNILCNMSREGLNYILGNYSEKQYTDFFNNFIKL